jgi:hypothetical protein
VLSGLAVSDDLAVGRLVEIDVPGLDLRRSLRAVWRGSASLPPGAARDLIGHILSHSPGRRADGRRARMRLDAPAPGESSAPRLQPVGEAELS